MKREENHYKFEEKFLEESYRVEKIFANVIDPVNPDIICLQEYRDGNQDILDNLTTRLYKVGH